MCYHTLLPILRPAEKCILRENVNGTTVLGAFAGCNNGLVENLPLHQIRNVWFQHDGAPRHKNSNVKQYLMETFQNQVIGSGGFIEWLLSSLDLTPLVFLWGHIKGQVYATPPPTLQDLLRSISDSCASVAPVMLPNMQREIQSRV
ncbi:hypothetical protein AVEN_240351-1 [Araneus ventricosus]|uniref:Uncharacterized protein n=1 Tax=Araneus ventricosus TaxID=182803 RepID=A0A4Y2F3S2_ARAVE|nr:hypothetical protein AVEN_240351-1 [Araneus ventricosus]